MANKNLQIRNSTAEFLIFTNQTGEDGIEVRYQNETIWLSQKMMATLFGCSTDNISLHLKNIFKEGELIEKAVSEEYSVTAGDGEKQNMGLTTWENAPSGKIIKTDVSVGKNYLTEKEIKNLDRFVTMYLDYAETQAERNIPMTMNDWANKLNAFLQFNEKEILTHAGKVTQAIAKAFSESEFEKFRIVQDKLFESDFDKAIKKLPIGKKK